ncbi:STAS/SEC14 domain-containing protein [Roseovarius aestuariivivens]|uniref:STAS/SEC14 domain-containing protein n=1 Tax=Roseovarius aestuariivivens TaxID=1888910 RepID=UPI001080E50C|nr:STAS/SEC14 domain-containing protein [Roseovarius aestuariivivens]
MPTTYHEDDSTGTAEITVSGRVTQDDFDAIASPLQDFIDRHGTIRLIEVIESLTGFDASMIWSGLKFDIRNIPHISHVAVVTDIGWLSPVSRAAGAVISCKLRTFPMADLDAARDWIRAPDG